MASLDGPAARESLRYRQRLLQLAHVQRPRVPEEGEPRLGREGRRGWGEGLEKRRDEHPPGPAVALGAGGSLIE